MFALDWTLNLFVLNKKILVKKLSVIFFYKTTSPLEFLLKLLFKFLIVGHDSLEKLIIFYSSALINGIRITQLGDLVNNLILLIFFKYLNLHTLLFLYYALLQLLKGLIFNIEFIDLY